ncbi:MAG: type II secretion system protein [Candidatus Gastranaerophilales bacterium]|nr:type II secretion system protein [Candidatus Gastranaerophilales bacterium]
MRNLDKRKGFTLAEVLITLMIIGILAVITIPSLIQTYQERETVTKLKKTYSVLQQAYKLAEIENGTPTSWGLTTLKTIDKMKPYLNIIKDCSASSVNSGCMEPVKYMNSDNVHTPSFYENFILADNVSIGLRPPSTYPDCKNVSSNFGSSEICSQIYVDINGLKGPNKFGTDVFLFALTDKGIIFAGGPATKNFYCMTTSSQGYDCAGWIILRGNMNYLRENIYDKY